MASLTHVAVGVAAGRFHGDRGETVALGWLMAFYTALSLLPDADVIAFAFGIPYGAPFGHRGASHSLLAAAACGVAVGLTARLAGQHRPIWWLLPALVVASHGLLDTLTDGGRGIALLWPLTAERYFAPWRPIPVAPIGVDFLSRRGLMVATAELIYSVPLFIYGWRRPRRPRRP